MTVEPHQLTPFANAVKAYCEWATSKPESPPSGNEIEVVLQLVADLVSTGCGLGWDEGCPGDLEANADEVKIVRENASALPFQYYSEVFNNLVLPPEEPVVGDLVDDLVDIFTDLSPGLTLYNTNRKEEAMAHWQFWFSSHWGEHATSAVRAMWSYLANREGSEVEDAI